jgi:hypothetical protein
MLNLDAGSATGGVAAVPPDPAAFADLLQQAYEAQAEALD